MSKILDFSELLVTKLCHDIAGAIGAVDNGVEFLEEMASDETRKKALELLSYSSSESVAKLKFFRYIYGLSSSTGEADISDVKILVQNFYKDSKHSFKWSQAAHEAGVLQLTNRASKLLCNMIYLMAESMISHGEVLISLSIKDHVKELVVEGRGEKFRDVKAISQILASHEQRDLNLENVQIHLTAKIATSLGIIIDCDSKKDHLKLTAKF